jgi:nucleoside-diphosphate-sugar epimerase
MRVLIAGCGYVGSSLGSLLSSEGHSVFGLRRNASALPPDIHPIRADLSAPLSPAALPPKLDVVVYAASPSGSSKEAYRDVYVNGPLNLLSALAPQRGLHRLIFVSSTGVYAQRGGEWVDEESPAEPESEGGKRLLEGEGLVLGSPIPAIALRLGGIYGPGRSGTIQRVLNGASDGEDQHRYINRIHRDDCVGALRHLILLEDAAPLYLGVDHEPATHRTVADWLFARLGEEFSPPGRNTSRNAPRVRTNKRCSNARLVSSGYRFRYPTFREGFAALLSHTPNSS